MTGSNRLRRAAGCSHNHCRSWVNIGSWNLRSLVESEGSVATASTRRGVQVDRKVNLLVGELCRFDIKWFGEGVYEMDGFVLVHSGRPVPADGEPVRRNEGVGILLNPTMATAWRNSGECWRTIISRIVSVRIQIQGCSLAHLRNKN